MNILVRLIIALVISLISVISYCTSTSHNPITQETQYLSLSPEEEIALGRKAAPYMKAQFGGLAQDQEVQEAVDKIGARIVEQSVARTAPYDFEFHVLSDLDTINAFALPGGQIFITEGLYRLLETPGELASVLGHEVGHVIARHSAEHIAKDQLLAGLAGAALIATDASMQGAQLAQLARSLIQMRFGRKDELEADRLGLRLMVETGYDPRAMIRLMQVLAEASGRGEAPEFFSTHPNPTNRIEKIKQELNRLYPQGFPAGLIK
jgi:beta-barrel assembly-enhancing protease